MSTTQRNGAAFHLQGGAILGALAGALAGAAFPLPVGICAVAVAAVVAALLFKKTLWPLLSRKKLYESLFNTQRVEPVLYAAEGIALGAVAGALAGIFLPGYPLLVLGLIGAAVLLLRYHETLGLLASVVKRGSGSSTRSSAAYRTLLAKAGGDRALVERLIAYEQRLAPASNREVCIERAIARWENDRR
ncbi:MAG: hypothetical protein JXD18_09975 [Anaerolineae bacterium]|nr:hypothetical protein [Anaerolineae bacterium]